MAPLAFLGSLVAIAWLPGRALLALARVRAGRLEQTVVSLALGLLGSTAIDWGLGFLGLRPLFWLWPLAACPLLSRLSGPGPGTPEEGAREGVAAVGALVALAVTALAFAPPYYRNLAPPPEGGLTFDALVRGRATGRCL